MESAYRSLLIPAVLSAISFATTFYVFDRLEKASSFQEDESNEAGYLKYSRNDIERRSKSRLLWQTVESGSKIYYGDAVRTAPRAEGNVQLVQGDTIITLEPNSLIVLERSKGQLQLNLLSGSLLVDSKGGGKGAKGDKDAGKGPIIKSGKTTVEIGKGTQLSMSKNQGSEANIAVVKGEAAVQAGGKEFSVGEGKTGVISATGMNTVANIEAISPAANSVVVLNNLKDRRLAFTFKPLPGDLRVSLETGPSRTELVNTGASATAASGAVAWAIPAEVFYWRLVAKDAAGKPISASVPMRAEGVYAAAPELFSPDASAMIVPKPGQEQLTFSWSKIPKAEKLRLQVSSDASFSKTIIARDFTDAAEFSAPMPAEGAYFWRVSAIFPGVKAPVASEARRFQVRKKIELVAPKLVTPRDNAHVMAADVKQGLFLEWDSTPAATEYEVTVTPKGGAPIKDNVAGAPYRLTQTAPGEYRWTVRAKLGEEASKWSASRKFTIDKAVELRWSVVDKSQQYNGEKPSAELRWQAPPPNVAKLKIRFARDGAGMAGATARDVTGNAVKVVLTGDGKFQFELQGLSSKGDVVALSKPLMIEVKRKPELDAPVLISKSATGPIKASPDGNAELRWQPVDGAKSYVITVKHLPSGKVKELTSKKPGLNLAQQKPGEYEVTLQAIDVAGKPGRVGKPKALVVPAVSSVAPPDVMEIKVH